MWVGTFAVFAVAVSCLVFQTSGPNYEKNFFKKKLKFLYKKSVISLLAICSGSFVFYGSYLNYQSTKLHSSTQYTKILKDLENKKYTNDQECLSFYKDFNRGGYILDRFLQAYNAHIITTNPDEIHDKDLRVLEELKCKANDLIKNNNFTLSLLSSSIQADTDFYYLFGDDKDKKDNIKKTYKYWLYKANILSEKMPQRGDLLLPFLSYAVSNGKSNDALNICRKSTFGLEAFCLLLEANNILLNSNIDEISLQNSINLIKKSVNLGLFNKITYGYWIKKCMPGNRQFCDFGIRGIPLSPDLIFLISNKEKLALEKLIRNQ